MAKTKIFIAVPSTGNIADSLWFRLRDLEAAYGKEIEFVYPKQLVQRKFHDAARNGMVEDFLASDADIMWFIDSDVVPPPNVLDLVTKYGQHWELAGAPYPVFITHAASSTAQIVLCVYHRDEIGMHAMKVPHEGTAFVSGLATGCIFIKREIFSKLKKPYFEFKYNPETRGMTEGEDLGFCMKVNDLGYEFFTDFSMVCSHYKTVNLLDVNNYAIDYAQNSLNNVAGEMKEQIYDAVKAAYREGFEKGSKKASGRTESGIILPK